MHIIVDITVRPTGIIAAQAEPVSLRRSFTRGSAEVCIIIPHAAHLRRKALCRTRIATTVNLNHGFGCAIVFLIYSKS